MKRDLLNDDAEDAVESDPINDDERFHDGEKNGRNEDEPFYGVSKERGSTGIGKLEIVKKRAKRTKFGGNMGTKEIGEISVTGKHGEPNSGPLSILSP